MTVDDPGQDVGEIGKRVDVVELAGLYQRRDGSPVFRTTIRSGKQSVFATELDDGLDVSCVPNAEWQMKVFHTFRHQFKRMCRDALLPEELHDALTGHSNKNNVGRSYHGKG